MGPSRARIPTVARQTGYSERVQFRRWRRRGRRAEYHLNRREHHPPTPPPSQMAALSATLPTGALRAPQYWLNMINLRPLKEPHTQFRAQRDPSSAPENFLKRRIKCLGKNVGNYLKRACDPRDSTPIPSARRPNPVHLSPQREYLEGANSGLIFRLKFHYHQGRFLQKFLGPEGPEFRRIPVSL